MKLHELAWHRYGPYWSWAKPTLNINIYRADFEGAHECACGHYDILLYEQSVNYLGATSDGHSAPLLKYWRDLDPLTAQSVLYHLLGVTQEGNDEAA